MQFYLGICTERKTDLRRGVKRVREIGYEGEIGRSIRALVDGCGCNGQGWCCQSYAPGVFAGGIAADDGVVYAVDDVSLIGKRAGDIGLCAVGGEGNSPGVAADGEFLAEDPAFSVDDD